MISTPWPMECVIEKYSHPHDLFSHQVSSIRGKLFKLIMALRSVSFLFSIGGMLSCWFSLVGGASRLHLISFFCCCCICSLVGHGSVPSVNNHTDTLSFIGLHIDCIIVFDPVTLATIDRYCF